MLERELITGQSSTASESYCMEEIAQNEQLYHHGSAPLDGPNR